MAHAVLDVLEEEKLQERALEVGNFVIRHLKELQKVHPLIGDVRYYRCFLISKDTYILPLCYISGKFHEVSGF